MSLNTSDEKPPTNLASCSCPSTHLFLHRKLASEIIAHMCVTPPYDKPCAARHVSLGHAGKHRNKNVAVPGRTRHYSTLGFIHLQKERQDA